MNVKDKVKITNGDFKGIEGVIVAKGQGKDIYHIRLDNGKIFAFSGSNIESINTTTKVIADASEDKPIRKRTTKKKTN